MRTVWAFLRLSRPHFLAGGVLMFALGVRSAGGTTVDAYFLGQALVTAAQLTAHYVNEYADRHADRLVANRTLFSGGSGVLAEGALAPRVALMAGAVTTTASVGLAVAVGFVSPPAAILGLVALAVSWAYSMSPLRLLDTGWGELITSLVVTWLVPMVGALVASGSIGTDLVASMAALLPVHMAMMLAFELPDMDTDRAAGKTVLAVRIGAARTRRLMLLMLLAPLAVVALAVAAGSLGVSAWWAVLVAAAPAGIVVRASRRGQYAAMTASAVAVLVILGGGLVLVL